ncbi:MAG: hypothetical protein ACFFER_20340, partial [Candidatus Thorarchaeota archaeon]
SSENVRLLLRRHLLRLQESLKINDYALDITKLTETLDSHSEDIEKRCFRNVIQAVGLYEKIGGIEKTEPSFNGIRKQLEEALSSALEVCGCE